MGARKGGTSRERVYSPAEFATGGAASGKRKPRASTSRFSTFQGHGTLKKLGMGRAARRRAKQGSTGGPAAL